MAAIVGDEPGVNHSYLREDEWNLWFVATAPTAGELAGSLERIARRTGLRVLDLPLLRPFNIDLGFRLTGPRETLRSKARARSGCNSSRRPADPSGDGRGACADAPPLRAAGRTPGVKRGPRHRTAGGVIGVRHSHADRRHRAPQGDRLAVECHGGVGPAPGATSKRRDWRSRGFPVSRSAISGGRFPASGPSGCSA